jgi:protein-S-isoprenylcysteine O-methyltransferase Ste14
LTKLEIVAMIVVYGSWPIGVIPFIQRLRAKKGEASTHEVVKKAPKAKIGIVVQSMAFFIAFVQIRPKDLRPPGLLVFAMILAPLSAWLAWRAVRHLGRQWQIQAALYSDHKLVRTGPYGFLRHPIYTAMLGMMIATGLLVSIWQIVIVAGAVFMIGTETRIREEDRLLELRFGDAFREYRNSVSAYIPFIR